MPPAREQSIAADRDYCPKCRGYGVYERRFWAPRPDTGWHIERLCPSCGWTEPVE